MAAFLIILHDNNSLILFLHRDRHSPGSTQQNVKYTRWLLHSHHSFTRSLIHIPWELLGTVVGLGHCGGYSLLRNRGIMQSISTSGGPVQETGNIGVGKLEGLKEWRSDIIGSCSSL